MESNEFSTNFFSQRIREITSVKKTIAVSRVFYWVLVIHLTHCYFAKFFACLPLLDKMCHTYHLVEIPWINNNVINWVITRDHWIEHHSWPSIKLIEIPHGFAIREFQFFLKVTCGVQFPLITRDDRINVTFWFIFLIYSRSNREKQNKIIGQFSG